MKDEAARDALAENRPLTPFEQQQRLLNDVAKGMATGGGAPPQMPATPLTSPPQIPFAAPTPEIPVATPPAAAAGPSVPNLGSAGGFGGGGGGGVPVSAPSAPVAPPMPLAPPATPPPAGPGGGGSGGGSGSGAGPGTGSQSGSGPTGPGVHAASTNNSSQAGVAPAPIPVSAARMERDAIASASTAAALQRQRSGGNDALTLARRIAAALNVGNTDYGFHWVTGLCADGTIVVANSYGIAYIPAGVNLPAQVQMATADESIPLADRAKWATYPMLAIQGWVHAHGQNLRAVIATEAQFANFDPGTAKVVLQPDDIPTTGKMQGRTRLEVIAPAAAALLASVTDAGLIDLLPPASADTAAPTDSSRKLWFNVCKPLMSTMPDRGIPHLELLITYAEHAQELALHRALTAPDADLQRAAIADWVYWQHLATLTADALNADVSA